MEQKSKMEPEVRVLGRDAFRWQSFRLAARLRAKKEMASHRRIAGSYRRMHIRGTSRSHTGHKQ
jgi:hypothetical protein